MVEQTDEQRRAAFDWINDTISFIVTPDEFDEGEDGMTVDWLIERMAAAVIRYNTDLFIIDPWNELDHSVPKDQTLTQYTGYAIRKFKKFAKHYDVHVCVVAHPAKMARDKGTGELPMPTLYDISDSAHWNNRTDLGIIVHKTQEGTVIRVAKSRYWDQIGPTGAYLGTFIRSQSRFHVDQEIVRGGADAR
jgi:twinkle protein